MKNLRNSVQIIGNVGNAPEIREFEGGKTMARFSVATNESFKNAEGQTVKNTTWHNFVAWGVVAKNIGLYVAKGKEIAVTGKLNNRSYEDKNGEKKYVTEIVVDDFLLLGKPE